MTVTLKHFQTEDLETVMESCLSRSHAEEHKWNGPYF